MKVKKYLSLFLTAAMVLGSLPATAWADEPIPAGENGVAETTTETPTTQDPSGSGSDSLTDLTTGDTTGGTTPGDTAGTTTGATTPGDAAGTTTGATTPGDAAGTTTGATTPGDAAGTTTGATTPGDATGTTTEDTATATTPDGPVSAVTLPAVLGEGETTSPYPSAATEATVASVVSITADDVTYYFDSMATAVEEAKDGDTLVLYQNSNGEGFTVSEKDLTIDLNDNTYTVNTGSITVSNAAVTFTDSGSNGTIFLNDVNGSIEIVGNTKANGEAISSQVNIEDGTFTGGTTGSAYIIYLLGKGATLNMTGGEVLCEYANTTTGENGLPYDGGFAISGNGTRNKDENRGGITINISGGTVSSTNDVAIYLPCENTTTISGDAVIEGRTGIEINSGNLTISGGTIRSTYETGTRHYKTSGDGSYNFGTALAIVSKGTQDPVNGYYGHMNINITGGTLESPFRAVDIYNLPGVQASELREDFIDSIQISGATLIGGTKEGQGAIVADTQKNFITSGQVNTDLTDTGYFSDDYRCVKENESDPYYTIKQIQGLQADVSASGGTATGTISGSFSETENGENVEGDAQDVIINAKTEGTVTKTELTITEKAAQSLADASSVQTVSIQTNNGTLSFNQEALSAMASANDTLTLKVEETSAGSFETAYELTLVDSQDRPAFTSGNVTATLSAGKLSDGPAYVYYLGANDVPLEEYEGTVSGGEVTVTLNHFSTYGITGTKRDTAVADVNGTLYTDLKEAITAANDSQDATVTVKLLAGVVVDSDGASENTGVFNITRSMTIDGQTHTVKASDAFTTEQKVHVFNITADDVEMKNITIDGNNKAQHGVHAYVATGIQLTNVTSIHNRGYGVVVNTSKVTADELYTSDNGWGGVNVDTRTTTTGNASFTMISGTLSDANALYVENTDTADTSATIINGGTFKGEVHLKDNITGATLTVKGGTFMESMADYADKDTFLYEVEKGSTFSYYKDAAEALNAAGTSGTVTTVGGQNIQQENRKTITFVFTSSLKKEIKVNITNGSVSVTMPEASRSNYRFLGWQKDADEDTLYQADASVSVSDNTTFTAQWKKKSTDDDDSSSSSGGGGSSSYNTYNISIDEVENGTITLSDDDAKKGEEVTITVTPDKGYEVESVSVTTSNNEIVDVETASDGTYTFTMPGRDVLVTATFTEVVKEEITMPDYTDVEEDAWYYDYVVYMVENGYMTGTSDTTFEPNTNLTRAMIAQILCNIEDGTASATSAFTDVAADQWYTNAINWAAEQNLVSGYGDGTFEPNDPITKEQMAVILYQYAVYKGYDVSASNNLSAFTDASSVSSWALPYVQWAVGAGVMSGMGNGQLNPTGTATRAEIATMMALYLQTDFTPAADVETEETVAEDTEETTETTEEAE